MPSPRVCGKRVFLQPKLLICTSFGIGSLAVSLCNRLYCAGSYSDSQVVSNASATTVPICMLCGKLSSSTSTIRNPIALLRLPFDHSGCMAFPGCLRNILLLNECDSVAGNIYLEAVSCCRVRSILRQSSREMATGATEVSGPPGGAVKNGLKQLSLGTCRPPGARAHSRLLDCVFVHMHMRQSWRLIRVNTLPAYIRACYKSSG